MSSFSSGSSPPGGDGCSQAQLAAVHGAESCLLEMNICHGEYRLKYKVKVVVLYLSRPISLSSPFTLVFHSIPQENVGLIIPLHLSDSCSYFADKDFAYVF